jgi:hypothetical protein
MTMHICEQCVGRFDCGYGDPCSSKWQRIDCPLCLADYIKMGIIEDLL